MKDFPYSIFTTSFSTRRVTHTEDRKVLKYVQVKGEDGKEKFESQSVVEPIEMVALDPLPVYNGRCKDVYIANDQWGEPFTALVVFTDRMQIENRAIASSIPYKGQINASTTLFFAERTKDIVSNCYIEKLHQNILSASYCKPIKIEFIVRGYLTGRLWEYYREGNREINGFKLKEGMKEYDQLETPILTPTLKQKNYDYQVSCSDIIKSGIITESTLEYITNTVIKLFNFGSTYAESKGLVLLDTMFEFGLSPTNKPILMDEILSIDHSRYISSEDLEKLQQGEEVELEYLPKLYLRKLFEHKRLNDQENKKSTSGSLFRGGISSDVIGTISQKYVDLYNKLEITPAVDHTFKSNVLEEMKEKVMNYF